MSADVVVLDASATVDLLLATEPGLRIAARVRGASGLLAPAHLDAEVLSALARLARANSVTETVAADVVDDLSHAPIVRVDIAPLLTDAWAIRDNVAARDALYVAIAHRAEATLITTDTRLARAVAQHQLAEVWTP